MKHTHSLALVGTTLILGAARAQADFADHLYLDVAAGPAFAQNPTVQSAPYTGGEVDFNTGFRGDVVLGYNICRSWAVELNTGVVWNSVDSINGNTLSKYSASADLYQIPLMVNAIYKVPLKGPFKPYIGAGVGVIVGMFDSSGIPGLYFPGGSQDFNATDTVFAYQAEVGCEYHIGEHAQFDLAYKFLGTTGYTWNANNSPLKTDGVITHAVTVSFGWRF